MPDVLPYRVGLEVKRNRCNRAQLKAFDRYLREHPALAAYYTGMVARRFCFHFPSAPLLDEFKALVIPALDGLGLPADTFTLIH